jgi:hypothetical protein|tara:strand:- start:956 stop:1708 length:753 start_codon:yes stop_codon:yes gene_type:complete
MNHTLNTEFFPYIEVSDIITSEEHSTLLEICNYWVEVNQKKIDSGEVLLKDPNMDIKKYSLRDLGRLDLLNNNCGINPMSDSHSRKWENRGGIRETVQSRLESIFNEYPTIFPLKLYNHKVGINPFCINLNYTADNEELNPLWPHTDYRFDILQNMGYGKLTEDTEETKNIKAGGIYKGVLYLGDSNNNYEGYGTRFYTSDHRKDEIKEIPFVPKNGVVFKTTKNSFHGTDFSKSGYRNHRFAIIFEYII